MAQYLKPDCELGYIEDTAEIECLKFNNLRHSVLGCMLGDFDDKGAYVVSPEVKKELISMEKYIVQTYDNIEICKSALRLDKQISFMVTYEGNKVTLSLIEKLNYEANFALNSGSYSNINEYVLDTVETSGEINRNMIYIRWNIRPVPSNIIDIFNCDESVLARYFGIVNRFKYLLSANVQMLNKEEELEEIEAAYANDMLEILKRFPTLNSLVLEEVKATLEEKKDLISPNKPYFSKTFNELLENSIAKNISSLDENELETFKKDKRNAVVDLNIKRQDVLDLEEVSITNEEGDVVEKVTRVKCPHFEHKEISECGQELASANREVSDRLTNSYGDDRLIARATDKNKERRSLYDSFFGGGEKEHTKEQPQQANTQGTTNPNNNVKGNTATNVSGTQRGGTSSGGGGSSKGSNRIKGGDGRSTNTNAGRSNNSSASTDQSGGQKQGDGQELTQNWTMGGDSSSVSSSSDEKSVNGANASNGPLKKLTEAVSPEEVLKTDAEFNNTNEKNPIVEYEEQKSVAVKITQKELISSQDEVEINEDQLIVEI